MDTQSLLVFILLPLLVLATAITLLLIQRARRKWDAGAVVRAADWRWTRVGIMSGRTDPAVMIL